MNLGNVGSGGGEHRGTRRRLVGRQDGGQDEPRGTRLSSGGVVRVWMNDVSLPYSQPEWTACHWWSGRTARPGWPAYGSARPSAASARPCGPTWACSPAGGCAAPCTDGSGSCRCPGTDAWSGALWTGGERRERRKQLGSEAPVALQVNMELGVKHRTLGKQWLFTLLFNNLLLMLLAEYWDDSNGKILNISNHNLKYKYLPNDESLTVTPSRPKWHSGTRVVVLSTLKLLYDLLCFYILFFNYNHYDYF